jgi:hypothetical protein
MAVSSDGARRINEPAKKQTTIVGSATRSNARLIVPPRMKNPAGAGKHTNARSPPTTAEAARRNNASPGEVSNDTSAAAIPSK